MSGDGNMMVFGGQEDVRVSANEATQEGVSLDNDALADAFSQNMGLGEKGATVVESPDVDKYLRRLSGDSAQSEDPGAEEAAGDTESLAEETSDKIVDDETGKEFDSKEAYLTWKIGNDGRKWGEERAALKEELAGLKGQLDAMGRQSNSSPQTIAEQRAQLKSQLFQNAPKEELESGFVSMDTLVDAFVQNGALLGQNIQQYLQPFIEKVDGLDSRTSEMAARSKYNIDPNKEKAVLQKHPYLKSLSQEERMAVLADLAPKTESNGAKPKAQIAQRIPKPSAQEYVEGSVQASPKAGGLEEVSKDFESLNSKAQLNLLSGLVAASPEAQSLFKPPEVF